VVIVQASMIRHVDAGSHTLHLEKDGWGVFLPVGHRATEEVEAQDFSGAVHAVSRRLHEHPWQAEKYSDECECVYHQRDGERRRRASDAAEMIKMEAAEAKVKAKAR
jgi:hypothetical protein